MYRKQVWNKSQTYFDGIFNSGAFFIYLTVRPSTDGKRAPLTAINLQAAGSPQQAPPTYIAKMWKLIKFRKNVVFSRNHTYVNPDDWTITKKTIRTTIHENLSKMKNLKVDRWALSLMITLILALLWGISRSDIKVVFPEYSNLRTQGVNPMEDGYIATGLSIDIFVEGPGPAMWISKGPKQILEGPSIEMHYNFVVSIGPSG